MKNSYQYTVLRYVHDILSGEFVNVATVLASASGETIARSTDTYGRISKLFPGVNGRAILRNVRGITDRLNELGARNHSELAFEPNGENIIDFVTTVLPLDDSSFQWSLPGTGLTSNLAEEAVRLHARFVTAFEEKSKTTRRTDEEVWKLYRRELESHRVLDKLHPKTITVKDDSIQFEHSWKNGSWHCLQAVSFDLANEETIRDKAHNWLGKMASVKDAKEDFEIYLLLGVPSNPSLRKAFNKATTILARSPVKSEIVVETESSDFARRVADDIERHTAGI